MDAHWVQLLKMLDHIKARYTHIMPVDQEALETWRHLYGRDVAQSNYVWT
jgi:hypothetical protein